MNQLKVEVFNQISKVISIKSILPSWFMVRGVMQLQQWVGNIQFANSNVV